MGRSLDEITKILEVVGLEKKRSQVYCLVYIIWAFVCVTRLYCHTAKWSNTILWLRLVTEGITWDMRLFLVKREIPRLNSV